MAKRTRGQPRARDVVKERPDFDPMRMTELIESCRAHVVSVTELADVTSKSLHQFYEYEENEPHLGQCCELVRQVLEQTQAAFVSLGVVAHDTEPQLRAQEIAQGCELQRLSLGRAIHVVRATSSILEMLKQNHHDHILLALHDIESGIRMVIDGLRRATQQ